MLLFVWTDDGFNGFDTVFSQNFLELFSLCNFPFFLKTYGIFCLVWDKNCFFCCRIELFKFFSPLLLLFTANINCFLKICTSILNLKSFFFVYLFPNLVSQESHLTTFSGLKKADWIMSNTNIYNEKIIVLMGPTSISRNNWVFQFCLYLPFLLWSYDVFWILKEVSKT